MIDLHDVTRTRDLKCPSCGVSVNALTNVENGDKPKTGDVSICLYCSAVLILGEDLEPVEANIDDILEGDLQGIRDAVAFTRDWQEWQAKQASKDSHD